MGGMYYGGVHKYLNVLSHIDIIFVQMKKNVECNPVSTLDCNLVCKSIEFL